MNEVIEMNVDFFSRLACYDMVEDAENIYYYANEKNVLYKLNKDTKENKILLKFAENLFYTYSSIQKVNEKLVLIPHCADDILIYDLKTDVVQKIAVKIPQNNINRNYDGKYKFWDSFVFHESVYMLGFLYPAIIKLNIYTMEVEYLTACCNFIDKRIEKDSDVYFVHGEVIENFAWISCASTNMMFRLNLESMEFKYYKIPLIDSGCGAFLYDGKCFWIGEWRKGFEKIVCWSPKEKIDKKFEIIKKKTNEWCPIRSMVDDGDRLHIFSFGNADVFQLDKSNGLIEKSEINPYCDCSIYNEEDWRIIALKQNETCLRFITGDYIWHEYNLKTKKYVNFEIKEDDIRILINIIDKKVSGDEILYENCGILPIYLEYVLNRDRESETFYR